MNRDKTHGMGAIGFLCVVIVTVFLVYLGFCLVPPYFENKVVRDSLKVLATEPDVSIMSKPRLKDAMLRRLEVNNIRHFATDKIEIKTEGGKDYLTLDYEVRVHIIGNMDAVLQFNNRVLIQ